MGTKDLAGSGGGGHTIREEGTDLAARTGLNFIGAGLTATDDAGGDETEITLQLVLEDLAALTAVADNEFIVGTGVGTYAHESGATMRTSAGLGTGDSPQFTGIELGHATDTTLTRSAAGILQVEGVTVLRVSGADVMTGDLDLGGNDVLSARNYYPDPGGRLCLTTGTPVHTSDAANQTTLFYALYEHDLVPLYDGTDWDVFRFTELSIVMGTNWAANSNYDVYVYNDAGTLRLVTGAAWTSDTARNETLTRVNGRWTNTASMTGRYSNTQTVTVAANRGLYVGTFRTTASTGTTTMEFGGRASGGDPGFIYVWNMYNRVPYSFLVADSDNSWTYSVATIRARNNSTSNRWSFVRGLDEDAVYAVGVSNGAGSASGEGVYFILGFDTTSGGATGDSTVGLLTTPTPAGEILPISSDLGGQPGLGLHFVQAMERGHGTGTQTHFGDNGFPTGQQGGFIALGVA